MNRVKLNAKARPPIMDRSDKPSCGICKRQVSNYICPKCNIPYCSLNCFKAEAHLECSEAFYRKEVEEEIKNLPNRSTQERRNMMEILRRFEEQSLQNEESLEAEEDLDGDELSQRLEGVDLDNAEPDAIWSLLFPAQREAFVKAMKHPTSELAQELLASEELQRKRRKPWWESPTLGSDNEKTSEFGRPPQMMTIPHHLASAAAGASIMYNILALCVAYAYVTRRLSVSPLCGLDVKDSDRTVARDLLFGLLPYLADRKSTLLLKSVDDLLTFLWAKLDALKDPPTNESFSLLLSDAWMLFKPTSVTIISENETNGLPSRLTLLVISDMMEFFGDLPKMKHVVHKLNFYAAHLVGQNTGTLKAVAEEARLTSLKLKSEAQRNESPIT